MSPNVSDSDESSTLTARQEQFIQAMLISSSIAAAAKQCKISSKTAQRWLAQPHVAKALKAARDQVLDHSMHTLQQASVFAVQALLRNVRSDAPPNVQVRSAQIILEYATQSVQIAELSERIAELEQLVMSTTKLKSVR